MLARNLKDIASYRQPMITSLGIIMGFLLNFLAGWATKEDQVSEIHSIADIIVAVTLLPALVLMLLVLYRMLDMRHKVEDVETIYMRTLRLYMTAIIMAFCGVAAALFF
ncbi:hypothetical protein [Aestuariivirga litoralis]|uniref:hypothetical protein n=1 Tax=Aestuariivirga litoralis TaxID=2650924 RepID=UPI0018C7F056|nr:hypothetical protein [Aestuariivirga litoralis]MBG1233617.1 hypothetical protein [Aestuariivirga litoralis]